jgi:hypothetical protein
MSPADTIRATEEQANCHHRAPVLERRAFLPARTFVEAAARARFVCLRSTTRCHSVRERAVANVAGGNGLAVTGSDVMC